MVEHKKFAFALGFIKVFLILFVLSLFGLVSFKFLFGKNIHYHCLVNFTDISPPYYGSRPYDCLTLSPNGTRLYGMTSEGGIHGHGCLFSVATESPYVYEDLFNFTNEAPSFGIRPYGSLTFSKEGDLCYGMTSEGGKYGYGCIFSISTEGTHTYTDLFDFTDTSPSSYGAYAQGTLLLSSDGLLLYGMASEGGKNGYGCIFSLTTDSSHVYTDLFDFTKENGIYPYDSLTLSQKGDCLYGMTSAGGEYNHGVIFALSLDAAHTYQKMVDFSAGSPHPGALPYGSLTLSVAGDLLYGMTSEGGQHGYGCLFSITTDDKHAYQEIFSFTGKGPYFGSYPQGSLLLSPKGDLLYGMTYEGGEHGYGCVFSVTTDDQHAYVDLLDFTDKGGSYPGAYPQGSLILSASGETLYGMTSEGGEYGYGCVFAIDLKMPK